MTELSDELLVAYVDGQLAKDQSKAIEKVLEHDEVAAERVEAMRAAHSRLEAAFEAMLDNELTALTGLPDSEAEAADAAPATSAFAGLRSLGAIAIIGGAICLTMAGAVAGYALRSTPEPVALVPPERVPLVGAPSAPRDWQDDLMIAHALFSRDSLSVGLESQGNIDLLRFHLGNVIGTEIQIPDLGPTGLTFKRAQILDRQSKSIAQLAYLPLTGDPVALYLQWDKGSDSVPATSLTGELAAAQWRQGNITYLLLGHISLPEMESLSSYVREQIANRNSLTSELKPPPTAAEARASAADPAPAAVLSGEQAATDAEGVPGASEESIEIAPAADAGTPAASTAPDQ